MKHFLLLLCLILCAGCSRSETVSGKPEKILSLSAAATRILYELGVPPVAIDKYSVIAAGEPAPEVIGKNTAVSREKIAELGIDCVILWNYQTDAVRSFREKQIQVIEIEPFRLRDYPALVRRLGALTDKNEKAESLCAAYQNKFSSIPKPEKMRNVYFELYGPFKSVGSESYAGDLLAMAGGCVMNQKTGLVSSEKLLAHKPEIIFYVEGHGSADEIRKRPGFSQFPAVRNNRIFAVPRRIITEGIAPLEAVEFFRKQIVKE